MPREKNINLFLMDGDASGRIKCTLANWTGVAYKIPHTEIEKCKNREDLKWSGVYFLFGVSDDTGENIAYIGQAGIRKNGEGILYRLMEHKRNPDKDYWTEAVVFTTSNNSFVPTEISYLENNSAILLSKPIGTSSKTEMIRPPDISRRRKRVSLRSLLTMPSSLWVRSVIRYSFRLIRPLLLPKIPQILHLRR